MLEFLAPDGWQVVLYFFLILQTIAVAMRLYAKLRILKEFRAEDYVIVAAWILSAAFHIGQIYLYYLDDAYAPILSLPPKRIPTIVRFVYAIEVLYPVATWTAKSAVGLMLVRIFSRMWYAKVVHVTMAIYSVFSALYFFWILFYCGNPLHWWSNLLVQKCGSPEAIYVMSIFHSVATALVDIIFVVIPWTYIRHANMDKRTKLSVGVILSLGSVSIFITFARIPFMHDLFYNTLNIWLGATQRIGVMSAIEIAICVTCFSLTSCKPLFKPFFTKMSTTVFHRSSARSNNASDGLSRIETRQTGIGTAETGDLEKAVVAKEESTVRVSCDGSSSSNYSSTLQDTNAHGAPAIVLPKEDSNEDAGNQDILTALHSAQPPRRHSTIDWYKNSEANEDSFGPSLQNASVASGRRQSTLSMYRTRRGSEDTFGNDVNPNRRQSTVSILKTRRGSEDPHHNINAPPGRRQSTVSWYDKYDSDVDNADLTLSAIPTAALTRRQSAVSWSSIGRRLSGTSLGRRLSLSSSQAGGGGGGRRFSRIRLGDLKFYGLFNKDVPISPQISRVTSRDMQFYGIEKLDAPPPPEWHTHSAVSPISDIEEGVENPSPQDAQGPERTTRVLPVLETLTTTNLTKYEGAGGGSTTLGVPGVGVGAERRREPGSPSSSKYSPVSPGTGPAQSS